MQKIYYQSLSPLKHLAVAESWMDDVLACFKMSKITALPEMDQ